MIQNYARNSFQILFDLQSEVVVLFDWNLPVSRLPFLRQVVGLDLLHWYHFRTLGFEDQAKQRVLLWSVMCPIKSIKIPSFMKIITSLPKTLKMLKISLTSDLSQYLKSEHFFLKWACCCQQQLLKTRKHTVYSCPSDLQSCCRVLPQELMIFSQNFW